MAKFVTLVAKTDSVTITEYTDGFWLWDATRGMNLSMRSKSPIDACIEALTYYQSLLTQVETKHRELSTRVDAFVSQFQENDHA